MKRTFPLIVAAILLLSVAACNKTDMNYEIYPKKENVKTDGQLYTGGEVKFPSSLWQTPAAERYDAVDMGTHPRVEGYFIDSVQETKVFAYVAVPETASPQNPVPGIVLVHGGGGTAFYEWVAFWVNRGYAAIAMDTEGNMPTASSRMNNNDHGPSVRNHGPLNAAFNDFYKPVEQQWAYHAAAAVIACNSYLRSLPCVDPDRIGITGISYGGFLTCQVAAYDDRFCFAAPVYGSLDQRFGDTWFGQFFKNDARKAALWDDNAILAGCKTPFFYLNGNVDSAFSVIATTLSDQKTEYSQMLLKYNFPHGHDIGGLQVPEVYAFADNICLGTAGLVEITEQPTAVNQQVKLKVPAGISIESVTGYYTTSDVLKETTFWTPVGGDYKDGVGEVSVPGNAKYFYINVKDSRNLEVSSHVIAL